MFQHPWVNQKEQNTVNTGERVARIAEEERNKSDHAFRHDPAPDSSLNFNSMLP